MGQLKGQLRRSKKRFKNLFRNPFFWTLTLVGNCIILVGSGLLWIFELDPMKRNLSFLDYVLWSAGLVTTIGYGNYLPQTTMGKLTVLGLMLIGTLFVWSYVAFLVTGLISPEFISLEKDVHDVEKDVRELKLNAEEDTKNRNSRNDKGIVV